MREQQADDLAADAWLSDEPIAQEAKMLVDAYDAICAAGDYDLAGQFFEWAADQINPKLSETENLGTYVLDDFFPHREGLKRKSTTAGRLEEIRWHVEAKIAENLQWN